MNPPRPRPPIPRGRGKRAGRPARNGPLVGDRLKRAIERELKPSGVVEKFLAGRVADALEAYDSAVPPSSFRVDPLQRTQQEVIDELYSALGQLRALQAHRRK